MVDKREKCVYCGKFITKRSREHIIQNAIGGLLESEDICCPDCNSYVSKYIDTPFTRIFNPIISRIPNITKTNNTNSMPSCKGIAMYNGDGKVYNVWIKQGKVVSCPELSKKLKCNNISKLSWEILAYEFNLKNIKFKNGLSKIAFNFALAKGVSDDLLKSKLDISIKNEKINDILFKYEVIPFIPMNPVDEYIELHTDFKLYHNLILFNQENLLWCYIDLFNTFQYYVLLSDKWNRNKTIYETYIQLIQKLDRSKPKISCRSLKDILWYSDHYKVKPCMDVDELAKRINTSIQKESQKKSMNDIIYPRISSFNIGDLYNGNLNKIGWCLKSFQLYMDDDDRFIENNFRTITLVEEGAYVVSYPLCIGNYMHEKIDINSIRSYTFKKFYRLEKFLNNSNKN